MSLHLEKLRAQLANDPTRARQLVEKLQLSQPTLSRTLAALGDEVVPLGAGPSIHYALRDTARGIGETPVYRVSTEGTLRELGTLIPVRPDGYVMARPCTATVFPGGFTICVRRAISVGRMRRGMPQCWGYRPR